MQKLHFIIGLTLLMTCFSCQEKKAQNQLENAALSFCKAFYNFDYSEAKVWATPSSLSYLSFLASNVQQSHLDKLKSKGASEVSIISSQIEDGSQNAIIICEIKNVLKIDPISGEAEKVTSLLDTLQLVNDDNKWLVRKDIPQRNEMQNHD